MQVGQRQAGWQASRQAGGRSHWLPDWLANRPAACGLLGCLPCLRCRFFAGREMTGFGRWHCANLPLCLGQLASGRGWREGGPSWPSREDGARKRGVESGCREVCILHTYNCDYCYYYSDYCHHCYYY